MKVIDKIWSINSQGSIGIIIIKEDVTGDSKAYIGIGKGDDEEEDTQAILAWGNKFSLDTVLRLKYFLTGVMDLTEEEMELIHISLTTHYTLTKDIAIREKIITIHQKLRGDK